MHTIKLLLAMAICVCTTHVGAQAYGHSANAEVSDRASRNKLFDAMVAACASSTQGTPCSFSVSSEKDKINKKEGPNSTITGSCEGGKNEKPLICKPATK